MRTNLRWLVPRYGSPVPNISSRADKVENSVTSAEQLAPFKWKSCDWLKAHHGYVQRNASMEANVSRKISVNVQKDIMDYVASFGSGVTTVRLVAGYLSEVLAQNPVSMVPAKLISVYVTSVGLEGCAIKKFHKQGTKRKILTKKKMFDSFNEKKTREEIFF
uniref:Uncharacterized protein n=1 Tax=Timema genevievae TaxID=629358 RepID=A0A7R9K0A9_TIMGE|nr:unnamed protein product [Timema genevievae]